MFLLISVRVCRTCSIHLPVKLCVLWHVICSAYTKWKTWHNSQLWTFSIFHSFYPPRKSLRSLYRIWVLFERNGTHLFWDDHRRYLPSQGGEETHSGGNHGMLHDVAHEFCVCYSFVDSNDSELRYVLLAVCSIWNWHQHRFTRFHRFCQKKVIFLYMFF